MILLKNKDLPVSQVELNIFSLPPIAASASHPSDSQARNRASSSPFSHGSLPVSHQGQRCLRHPKSLSRHVCPFADPVTPASLSHLDHPISSLMGCTESFAAPGRASHFIPPYFLLRRSSHQARPLPLSSLHAKALSVLFSPRNHPICSP